MAGKTCTNCAEALSTCRIQCSSCPQLDLCLQCFALGAEAGGHKKDHDYSVHDDGYVKVFDNENPWCGNEEDALLDAVEQYGFGNWEDASGHVGSRTAEECREHYYAFYIHGNIGKATFPTESISKVKDHTCPDGGPLSPSLHTTLPPLDLTILEQQELGYMPFRDDFEREYDNEAETLVSGLSLNYDDEDIDIAFKLAQVDMYRQRLKERQRRKRIAREYGVIASASTLAPTKKVLNNKSKKLSKEDKEFQDRMRVFGQLHSAKEHDQFFETLQKEKKLKSRVKELMRYRRNGVTKLDDVGDFEAERYRREKKKENKKKLASLAALKRTSMGSRKVGERVENGDDASAIIIGISDKDTNGVKEVGGYPGPDLLSDREKKLCHSIGMNPTSYITIKTCIIKDYLQRRQGTSVKIRYPSHLDKTHRRKILNFLSENGWIGGVGVY